MVKQHVLHGTRQHWADVLKPKLSSEKLVNGLWMQSFRHHRCPFDTKAVPTGRHLKYSTY